MLATAPPLPAQPLVGLLADLRADAARHAAQRGALAALHALICAALIRLFAGLHDLMDLWRSGQLPPQSSSPAEAQHLPRRAPVCAGADIPARLSRPRQPAATFAAARPTAAAVVPAETASRAAPRHAPAHAAKAPATPSPRPPIYPRIRLPPWPGFLMAPMRLSPDCALNVPI